MIATVIWAVVEEVLEVVASKEGETAGMFPFVQEGLEELEFPLVAEGEEEEGVVEEVTLLFEDGSVQSVMVEQ